MKKRLFALLALLGVAGALTAFVPRARSLGHDEAWLEAHTPKEMPGYSMLASANDPAVSYRMDDETYKKLQPLGIAARVFQSPKQKIDTVVISGDSADNFHDPTWCLPGQGWEIGDRKTVTLHSDKLGSVNVSYFEAKQNDNKMIVAYTFAGPSGYRDSITKLTLDMWKQQFLSGKAPIGAFYRFLMTEGNPTIESMEPFMVSYLERSHQDTGGLL